MTKSQYVLKSFIHAGGVFIYVSCVSWLMSNASDFFGHDDTFVTPIFVLLLFVISATVTSLLVLGKPVSLFLAGSKKEAFMLLFSTLVWLVVFLLTVALIMFNFK